MSCLFCQIVEGKIPARMVLQEDDVVAFHDIDPKAPTHILVVPSRHIASIQDLAPGDDALIGRLVRKARDLARKHGLAERGFRLVFNAGDDAGYSVHHIHLHLVGGRKLAWPPGSSQSSSVPEPAEIAGRYQIIKKLGAGAFGTVYKAKDKILGRMVAIKTIRLEGLAAAGTGLDELMDRFKREAQVSAQLKHPNIVTIYDIGEAGGVSYIAMEFIDGVGLDRVIATGGQLPLERAVVLGAQVADALDFAHRNGVVHRDIKPANIMVEAGDRVKVTDFGIAKVMDSADHLTMTGSLLGTPSYMSPEQAKGAALDGRSDLFAVGCILYEMLAGRKAFRGDSITGLIFKIITEEPPSIREVDPDRPRRDGAHHRPRPGQDPGRALPDGPRARRRPAGADPRGHDADAAAIGDDDRGRGRRPDGVADRPHAADAQGRRRHPGGAVGPGRRPDADRAAPGGRAAAATPGACRCIPDPARDRARFCSGRTGAALERRPDDRVGCGRVVDRPGRRRRGVVAVPAQAGADRGDQCRRRDGPRSNRKRASGGRRGRANDADSSAAARGAEGAHGRARFRSRSCSGTDHASEEGSLRRRTRSRRERRPPIRRRAPDPRRSRIRLPRRGSSRRGWT